MGVEFPNYGQYGYYPEPGPARNGGPANSQGSFVGTIDPRDIDERNRDVTDGSNRNSLTLTGPAIGWGATVHYKKPGGRDRLPESVLLAVNNENGLDANSGLNAIRITDGLTELHKHADSDGRVELTIRSPGQGRIKVWLKFDSRGKPSIENINNGNPFERAVGNQHMDDSRGFYVRLARQMHGPGGTGYGDISFGGDAVPKGATVQVQSSDGRLVDHLNNYACSSIGDNSFWDPDRREGNIQWPRLAAGLTRNLQRLKKLQPHSDPSYILNIKDPRGNANIKVKVSLDSRGLLKFEVIEPHGPNAPKITQKVNPDGSLRLEFDKRAGNAAQPNRKQGNQQSSSTYVFGGELVKRGSKVFFGDDHTTSGFLDGGSFDYDQELDGRVTIRNFDRLARGAIQNNNDQPVTLTVRDNDGNEYKIRVSLDRGGNNLVFARVGDVGNPSFAVSSRQGGNGATEISIYSKKAPETSGQQQSEEVTNPDILFKGNYLADGSGRVEYPGKTKGVSLYASDGGVYEDSAYSEKGQIGFFNLRDHLNHQLDQPKYRQHAELYIRTSAFPTGGRVIVKKNDDGSLKFVSADSRFEIRQSVQDGQIVVEVIKRDSTQSKMTVTGTYFGSVQSSQLTATIEGDSNGHELNNLLEALRKKADSINPNQSPGSKGVRFSIYNNDRSHRVHLLYYFRNGKDHVELDRYRTENYGSNKPPVVSSRVTGDMLTLNINGTPPTLPSLS